LTLKLDTESDKHLHSFVLAKGCNEHILDIGRDLSPADRPPHFEVHRREKSNFRRIRCDSQKPLSPSKLASAVGCARCSLAWRHMLRLAPAFTGNYSCSSVLIGRHTRMLLRIYRVVSPRFKSRPRASCGVERSRVCEQ